ncbi:MAG TPA: hypothetical protein PKV16_07145 [Caldisericia bacterium]|nr:hypothetical protein [Caldisericia bacterium]HPF49544.1 hypothetical protein [Caldisericia bacterium]HPI84162.1 hypothetical protein [Caldisericia bacterium]HPQ93543.1 hypothetical protein [Caldisericia bacterium]HRV75451.1 hypothetical protein [Caldisericia bacterium]
MKKVLSVLLMIFTIASLGCGDASVESDESIEAETSGNVIINETNENDSSGTVSDAGAESESWSDKSSPVQSQKQLSNIEDILELYTVGNPPEIELVPLPLEEAYRFESDMSGLKKAEVSSDFDIDDMELQWSADFIPGVRESVLGGPEIYLYSNDTLRIIDGLLPMYVINTFIYLPGFMFKTLNINDFTITKYPDKNTNSMDGSIGTRGDLKDYYSFDNHNYVIYDEFNYDDHLVPKIIKMNYEPSLVWEVFLPDEYRINHMDKEEKNYTPEHRGILFSKFDDEIVVVLQDYYYNTDKHSSYHFNRVYCIDDKNGKLKWSKAFRPENLNIDGFMIKEVTKENDKYFFKYAPCEDALKLTNIIDSDINYYPSKGSMLYKYLYYTDNTWFCDYYGYSFYNKNFEKQNTVYGYLQYIVNDSIIINHDWKCKVFSPSTQEFVREFEGDFFCLHDNYLITKSDKRIRCYNFETGEFFWEKQIDILSGLNQDKYYIDSKNLTLFLTNRIEQINLQSGETIFNHIIFETQSGNSRTDYDVALLGDNLFVSHRDELSAIDFQNGNIVKEWKLTAQMEFLNSKQSSGLDYGTYLTTPVIKLMNDSLLLLSPRFGKYWCYSTESRDILFDPFSLEFPKTKSRCTGERGFEMQIAYTKTVEFHITNNSQNTVSFKLSEDDPGYVLSDYSFDLGANETKTITLTRDEITEPEQTNAGTSYPDYKFKPIEVEYSGKSIEMPIRFAAPPFCGDI